MAELIKNINEFLKLTEKMKTSQWILILILFLTVIVWKSPEWMKLDIEQQKVAIEQKKLDLEQLKLKQQPSNMSMIKN